MGRKGVSKNVLNAAKNRMVNNCLSDLIESKVQRPMKYEHVQIFLTKHAHERYCERVQHISYAELTDQCNLQLHAGEYGYNESGFIHLSGVWWNYTMEDAVMKFITCYGITTADLPAGLRWAQLHNDRIDLKTIIS